MLTSSQTLNILQYLQVIPLACVGGFILQQGFLVNQKSTLYQASNVSNYAVENPINTLAPPVYTLDRYTYDPNNPCHTPLTVGYNIETPLYANSIFLDSNGLEIGHTFNNGKYTHTVDNACLANPLK